LIHAGFNSPELIYRLPKARADGSTQLHLTALELIDRLAALIPPPCIHPNRYHGVLAPLHPCNDGYRAMLQRWSMTGSGRFPPVTFLKSGGS
jgi:hypothetical protein